MTNIVKYNNADNSLDNKIILLELIVIAKHNAQNIIQNKLQPATLLDKQPRLKLQEKFTVDERLLQENDAINYYNSLNAIQSWLDNSYNGEYGILSQISSDLQTASTIRNTDKQAILQLLTNVYVVSYINATNKQNAEAYKVFSKYNDPTKNKYYSQYTR